MELDSDRCSEPKRLCREVASCELGRAGRQLVGVVVPLKRVEPARERVQHGVLADAFHGQPAHLGLRRGMYRGAGGLRDQLRTETDAEQRRSAVEVALQELVLAPQPRVLRILVGVHRSTEDEHHIVPGRRLGAEWDAPGVELVPCRGHRRAEDAGPDVRAVGDRENLHLSTATQLRIPRMDARPIGVFDSGVGGLTVLHECLVTLPHEDFVYLGDHARLPYGPRPLDELRRFSREIGAYLEAGGVKLIVVACNSATAAALPELQTELRVPVVGVIAPEAHAAVQATRNRRIGLLATEATVRAGRYADLVHTLDAGAELFSVACPELVPLIESDDPFGEPTTVAVRRYAEPLKDASVDTVILGCTHYPLIRPILQRVFGRGVTLVFSAEETGREVAQTLARKGIENDVEREGTYRFLTTGDPTAFRTIGRRFLQLPIEDVEVVEVAALEAVA